MQWISYRYTYILFTGLKGQGRYQSCSSPVPSGMKVPFIPKTSMPLSGSLEWNFSCPQSKLRGTGPIPLSTVFLPSFPHIFHLITQGFPPIPLGVSGPPRVPSRCPSCEETQALSSYSTISTPHLFIHILELFVLAPLGKIVLIFW